MAPANYYPRWAFELLPYTWQRPIRVSEHSLALFLVPLLATSLLLALDSASAANTSPIPQQSSLPTSQPMLRPTPPQPSVSAAVLSTSIQGTLQYRTIIPSGQWILLTSANNGNSISYTLPSQPVDAVSGLKIPQGRVVSLTCFLPNSSTTTCSDITNSKIYSFPYLNSPASNVTLRVLVVVVGLNKSSECNSQGGADVTQVRSVFLGPNSYADFFKNCSYRRMVFDRQAFTVVSSVIPCSTDIIKNCKFYAIANASLRQLPADIQIGLYSNIVYVLPDGLERACGFPAVAEILGRQTWVLPNNDGIFSKGRVMQEMLHNFGLWHGWRNGVENDDNSTAMGWGASCPSAPELWRLGWATPLAQLNSSTFPLATYMNFVLPATYLGPAGIMIKIQPDWLGTNNYTKNLYLALRVKAAGDRDLSEEFNGKLNIHELSSTIDNKPSFAAGGDPKVTIIAALSPNSSVMYFQYQLYLLVGDFDNKTSTIMVTICRFFIGPYECTDGTPSLPVPWPQPPSPPAVRSSNIQGTLQYRPIMPSGQWILLTSADNGSSISYTLPYQPIDALSGLAIPQGRVVSLTCFLPNSSTTTCSDITNSKIYSFPYLNSPASNVTLRVLVVVVGLNKSSECNSQGGADVTQVRSAFLGPNSYADFFMNCSYRRMVFDRQAFTVVSSVIPCSTDIIKNCKFYAIANASLRQLPADIQIGLYSNIVYVLPDGLERACGFPGIAEISGRQTWVLPNNDGIFSKGRVMQEMLHNFGLWHGWRNGVENDDNSTAMGWGASCPSAPELWRLGWATPLAQLNSSTFPLATYMNFVLPATYLGPAGIMIKIQPDWLGTNNYTKNLYLALRVKAEGDRDLSEEFNGKLNIHELSSTIDNKPSFAAGGDPKVTIIAALSPNSSFTFLQYQLYLLVGAFDNKTSTIIVTICRFANGPRECTDAIP
ncbi:hypothetical protein Vafri_11530 [Volvox africanus]|nr:hypothetical protein Vafri_11530 [Volvox africanus]